MTGPLTIVDFNNNIKELMLFLSVETITKNLDLLYLGYSRSINIAMISQRVQPWTWAPLRARCEVWRLPFMSAIDLLWVSFGNMTLKAIAYLELV